MSEPDPFSKLPEPSVSKARWSWWLPLIGLLVVIVVGGIFKSGLGLIGFVLLVLAGMIVSVVSLFRSKGNPKVRKHGIIGLIVSILFAGLIAFAIFATVKVVELLKERESSVQISPVIERELKDPGGQLRNEKYRSDFFGTALPVSIAPESRPEEGASSPIT